MKNLHLFLITGVLLGMMACNQKANKTVSVSGTMDNASGETIEIMYISRLIDFTRETFTDTLEGEGHFHLEFDLEKPVMTTLSMSNKRLSLFLEPGMAIRVEANAEDFPENIVLEGKGSAENNFLNDFNKQFGSTTQGRAVYDKMRDLDAIAFKAFIEEAYGEMWGFFDRNTGQQTFSPEFIHYFKTQLTYEPYQHLLSYPLMHMRTNQLAELPELPSGYYDFLDQADLSDHTMMISPAYRGFLSSYLSYYIKNVYEAAEEDSRSSREIEYEVAGNIYKDEQASFIQASILRMILNYSPLEVAEPLYLDYIAHNQVAEYSEALTKIYDSVIAIQPGLPAPEFTHSDLNGKEYSLSDFRGKVVYLDFWASWCGPCIQQMPYAKELKKRMADQSDLVFLYVSVDSDETAWRNGVNQHEIEGINLHAGTDGASKAFNVTGIPAFFLIGRDGTILDHKAPRPSAENIDQVLLDALKL
jgi:thiol-disulfide isomerase/thioredoxin